MFFFDTETVGFHGPIVLIQWAEDGGPIHLHNVWLETIQTTLDLCEKLASDTVVGFNLAFDWFHICQTYTTLLLLKDAVGGTAAPLHHIETYAICEEKARWGPCLKPKSALDLMLHARKGPYQSTMNRGDVRISRVPTDIVYYLRNELNLNLDISELHFARFKDPERRKNPWVVYDVEDATGEIMPDVKDLVLKFNPSAGLKILAVDMGLADEDDEVIKFDDINVMKEYPVEELGYAPFAMAIGEPGGFGSWNGAWPQVIRFHVTHWTLTKPKQYAIDDVKYTRGLYYKFDSPPHGDDDSILACMVGAVRWSGFALDVLKLKDLHAECDKFLRNVPYNFNSVAVVKKYLGQVLSDDEMLVIRDSTKKIILEDLATWEQTEVCEACGGLGVIVDFKKMDAELPCLCDEGQIRVPDSVHPVAERARLILDFRRIKNEKKLYEKLIKAGRFHVDVNVIGTLSSRMSGKGGVNSTGINKQEIVRECFPLADLYFILCGGDFSAFEVSLMDAAYGDPQLHEDLISRRPCIYCTAKRHLPCSGSGCDDCASGICKECDDECTAPTKIHALFGTNFFEGMTYADILKTKGLKEELDKYSRSKNGLFALAYGGEAYTLMTRVGVSEEAAMKGYDLFLKRYPTFAKERAKVKAAFSPVDQPDKKPFWVQDPEDCVLSMFGFPRYFTMENKILKLLWNLCQNPPKYWFRFKHKIVRREERGAQRPIDATRSALLGAMFKLQGANTRAAGNHKIQSAGAHLCKKLQRRMWDLQPVGCHRFEVKTMNVHDEIMVPAAPELVGTLDKLVKDFTNEYKAQVPLLDIDWKSHLTSWAGK
jgi:hypothetical protein